MKFYSISILLITTKVLCSKEFTFPGANPNTKELLCEGLSIHSISKDSLKRFKNLRKLTIRKTSLKAIPDGLESLKNLNELDFSNNHLATCFKNLRHCRMLSKLTLKDNKMLSVPGSIKNLDFLIFLDLTGNTIKNLENLENSKIRSLTLLDNQIDDLVDMSPIGKMYSLKSLYLSRNNLSKLCFSFANLQNLKILNLDENNFKEIPVVICVIRELHVLQMRFNKIESFNIDKQAISSLKREFKSQNDSLERISLFNRFKMLSKIKINSHMKDLTVFLEFSETECKHILKKMLMTCNQGLFNVSGLRKINLNGNLINEIPKDFEKLKLLSTFEINRNLIKEIPVELIELKYLVELDVSCNEIRQWPSALPMNYILFKNYLKFNLHGNFISPESLNLTGGEAFRNFMCGKQFKAPTTLNQALEQVKNKTMRWNVENIKKIRIPPSAVVIGSDGISDKMMQDMWSKVLKYYVNEINNEQANLNDGDNLNNRDDLNNQDGEQDNEVNLNEGDDLNNQDGQQDIEGNLTDLANQKNSIDQDSLNELKNPADYANMTNHEYLINQILKSEEFKSVKKSKVSFTDNEIEKNLRNDITTFLRGISFDNTEVDTEKNIKLKNYIKALFSIFLEKIYENKTDLEDLRVAITSLAKNNLVNCLTGQMEGLMHFHSIYFCNVFLFFGLERLIENRIASIKEQAFVATVSGNGEQNVHKINEWKYVFQECLGISYDLVDPYNEIRYEIWYENKKGCVLLDFLDIFTIERVLEEVLRIINLDKENINNSLYKLHKMLSDTEIDYGEIIKKYFDFIFIEGFDDPVPVKLKMEGLLLIFKEMKLILEE